DEEHAVLDLHRAACERGRGALDALGQLRVADRVSGEAEGGAAAAALGQVAINEEGGGVEALRKVAHATILAETPPGRRGASTPGLTRPPGTHSIPTRPPRHEPGGTPCGAHARPTAPRHCCSSARSRPRSRRARASRPC